MSDSVDLRIEFLGAATWHGSTKRADALLAAHPGLGRTDIHTAAVLGDDVAVREFLAANPAAVREKSPPHGAEPLVSLCLSKYLRLDPTRSEAFLRAATALLDAGADPNSGFWADGEFETALYGAAGVAHHAELTALLLQRGADPTDVEVVYHSPEGRDSQAMQLVVETGKLSADDLCLMLIRKSDWHDVAGVQWLLEHGVDLNLRWKRGWTPLHHAIERGNDLPIVKLMLDHGADVGAVEDGLTVAQRAARRGRADVLEELERRGHALELSGVYRLLAACARGDATAVQAIVAAEPSSRQELLAQGGNYLGAFAVWGNTGGVRLLLDLGIPVDAPNGGDGYFDIAPQSTALHISAWTLDTPTLTLLLERGAPVNAKDAKGRTPLARAVSGCVDSYWTEWRSPEPARALLEAGATTEGVRYPSGYAEVDALLAAHHATPTENAP